MESKSEFLKLKLKQSALEVTTSVREVHDAHRSVQHSGVIASRGLLGCVFLLKLWYPPLKHHLLMMHRRLLCKMVLNHLNPGFIKGAFRNAFCSLLGFLDVRLCVL